MAERKYSVGEIDLMRIAVSDLWMGPIGDGQIIEARLRTYMLNGTEPAELEEAARPIRLARSERFCTARPGAVIPISGDWFR